MQIQGERAYNIFSQIRFWTDFSDTSGVVFEIRMLYRLMFELFFFVDCCQKLVNILELVYPCNLYKVIDFLGI